MIRRPETWSPGGNVEMVEPLRGKVIRSLGEQSLEGINVVPKKASHHRKSKPGPLNLSGFLSCPLIFPVTHGPSGMPEAMT
jgi:hypothetical protein